jgi:uncharacterized Zn finger protein
MPKKEKFVPKIPPNHLYCPICGDKAISKELIKTGESDEATVFKYCNKCGATWQVKYYLKPIAITNIVINYQYEDIPL